MRILCLVCFTLHLSCTNNPKNQISRSHNSFEELGIEKIDLETVLNGTWIPQQMFNNLKETCSKNDQELNGVEGVIVKFDCLNKRLEVTFKLYERQNVWKAFIDTMVFDKGKIKLYANHILFYKRDIWVPKNKEVLSFDILHQTIHFDTGKLYYNDENIAAIQFKKYCINELIETSALRNKVFNESTFFKKKYLIKFPNSPLQDTVTPILGDWKVVIPYGKNRSFDLVFIHFDTDTSSSKKMFFWIYNNGKQTIQDRNPYIGVLTKDGVLSLYKCSQNPFSTISPKPCTIQDASLFCTLTPFRQFDPTGYWE